MCGMNFNQGYYYPQNTGYGTTSLYQGNSFGGQTSYGNSSSSLESQLFGNSFGYSSMLSPAGAYVPQQNSYQNQSSGNSLINILLNLLKAKGSTTEAETTATGTSAASASTTAATAAKTNTGFEVGSQLALSDPFGGAIPINYALIQEGLFGNFHGTQSIISRYVADIMPTDKDAPGYTWKYTIPGQSSATAASTATTAKTSTGFEVGSQLALSDPFGGAIPTNYALIQEGLFGNVHGTQSIISRYVSDIMPTDKDAPGYTWKYTLPGA